MTGGVIITEGHFPIPQVLSFRNHQSYDGKGHAFEVMKTFAEYNATIPAWS